MLWYSLPASVCQEGCLLHGRHPSRESSLPVPAALRCSVGTARCLPSLAEKLKIMPHNPTEPKVFFSSNLNHTPPNKALEPTATSVMPRAIVCFFELKLQTEVLNQARATPAVAVAHL